MTGSGVRLFSRSGGVTPGDFGSARRSSTGLYGEDAIHVLPFFLGTGCMIKLQSSMSKHIPVSAAALSPGCHFVFYFVVVSPLWLLLKISALPFPGWPSRFFGKKHALAVTDLV